MNMIKQFFKDESGASMVEYGVLVALIAIAVIATVVLVGAQLDAVFQRILACLQDSGSAGCTGA